MLGEVGELAEPLVELLRQWQRRAVRIRVSSSYSFRDRVDQLIPPALTEVPRFSAITRMVWVCTVRSPSRSGGPRPAG